jgi:hypothetical protein
MRNSAGEREAQRDGGGRPATGSNYEPVGILFRRARALRGDGVG